MRSLTCRGFVLTAAAAPTVYVSGDNASLDRVHEIARRFPAIDVAVLFAGGAKSPKLLGEAYLTLNGEMAAQAAAAVGAPIVVPVHYEGWGHFTEGITELRAAFDAANLADRLVVLEPGKATQL
jgi:L-ascorbate metabolism protein UlaG (beta-lactamase superfamily)